MHDSIKAGDPAGNSLHSVYDGPRPKGYETMKKQGGMIQLRFIVCLSSVQLTCFAFLPCSAIILGIGGDNSPWAAGTFYEGAMTYGFATDETEAAVFANIVAAGYGK